MQKVPKIKNQKLETRNQKLKKTLLLWADLRGEV